MKEPVLRGGVISKAKVKTDTDWLIYRASSIPGPKYDLPPMRVNGLFGKIGDGNPKSNLEWIIYQSSQLPGPFEYRLQGDFEEAAGEKRAGGMIKMKRHSSAPAALEPLKGAAQQH